MPGILDHQEVEAQFKPFQVPRRIQASMVQKVIWPQRNLESGFSNDAKNIMIARKMSATET